MNTTEKGNELEEQVYKWLEETLDERGHFVSLRHHKGYKCSNGRIIYADVSIDCYISQEMMEADTPSMTYIFECKNLKNNPDISDLDEWQGKLRYLGSSGYKLYLVTRVGFSKQTIKDAEDNHIGLIRFPYDLKPEYILPRIHQRTNHMLMSMNDLMGVNPIDYVVCYDNYSFIPFADLFVKHKLPIKQKYKLDIPYLSKDAIEQVTDRIFTKYGTETNILASLVNDVELPIITSKGLEPGLLGYLDIPLSRIYVSSDLEVSSPRYRFVLAHEYGHFFLHRDALDGKYAALYETEESLKTLVVSKKQSMIMEWQANMFASFLLLPRKQFAIEVLKAF